MTIIGRIWVTAEAIQREEAITAFKEQQAEKLMEHIGPNHDRAILESVRKLQEQLRSMPNQLFVQTFLMTSLCEEVIRFDPMYWSQRAPKELGQFVWTIDTKDKTITETEQLWQTLVKPFLASRTYEHPIAFVDDPKFDYTFLEQHAVRDNDDSWKNHFHWLEDVLPDAPTSGIDLKPLFRDFTFDNSQDYIGLQLVDIVGSTFHRACKGTLQKPGWKDLGSLFLSFSDVVSVVALGSRPDNIPITDSHVGDVIISIRRGARSPWLE